MKNKLLHWMKINWPIIALPICTIWFVQNVVLMPMIASQHGTVFLQPKGVNTILLFGIIAFPIIWKMNQHNDKNSKN